MQRFRTCATDERTTDSEQGPLVHSRDSTCDAASPPRQRGQAPAPCACGLPASHLLQPRGSHRTSQSGELGAPHRWGAHDCVHPGVRNAPLPRTTCSVCYHTALGSRPRVRLYLG